MERLMITSIRSRLDERENSMRDEIMNEIIDAGGPVAVDSICIKMEAEEEQRRGIIESLLAKRVIVLDGENQYITFVYPVSALPTAHKVTLADGRSFFAMCAIDSLGAAFTFKQDTQVQSQCAACGAPVAARVVNGQLHEVQPASLFILHVDLACTDNWAGSCWNIMNFFCTKEHYLEWIRMNGIDPEDNFGLDAEDALHAAKILFG